MCESCVVSFIWGQNEDCSSEDSISDSSDKLLQRGSGEGQYICDFDKGRIQPLLFLSFFPFFFFFLVESFCWSHETPSIHEKQSSL